MLRSHSSAARTPDAPRGAADDGPRLGLPAAQLVAWIGLAAVNTTFIAALRVRAPVEVRVLHHLYAAGQLFAAGLVAASVVRVWDRFGPNARTWSLAALGLGALGVAWVFIPPDLANLAERIAPEGRAEVVLDAITIAAALVVAGAALVGLTIARPRLRWIGVAAALVVAVANDIVLPHDYRGVHLFLALAAAILGASSLGGMRLPRRLGGRRAGRFAVAVRVLIGVIGATTVLLPPRPSVRAEMFRIDGAVIAPVIARVKYAIGRRGTSVPSEDGAWYRDRSRLPPVPPSSPRLVPADGVVLLVSVDSMGASLFSKRATRRHLPRLERLRRESVDFALARSPSSRTVWTWSSVFTGRYFSGIAWRGINPSTDRSIRFSALLSKAGITTVNVICADPATARSQLGERNLRGGFTEEVVVRPRRGQPYATSTEAMPIVIERLRRHARGPLFVFAHLMDSHYPYDSVKRKGSRFGRFLAEVQQADRAIGELWDAVEALGVAERTTLIVTADHGEGFGRHDTPYHTLTLYEELIRVPLLVRVPGVPPHRIERPVTLMDLGPTILDLFGLPTPARFLGESLVPYLRGADPALRRPIAAERPGTRAIVFGSRKVIIDSEKDTEEIYDLAADPNETRNQIEAFGAAAEVDLDRVETFFDAHGVRRRRWSLGR